MNIKNPIKHYLTQCVRTNGKQLFFAWIGVLIFGLLLVIGRVIHPITRIFSEHILSEFVIDLPLKAAFMVIPLILFYRSKMYKEWQEANPDTSITKRDFTTAIYFEIFLSTFLGIFALGIIWFVAGLVDPTIVERILKVGIFGLGEGFLLICL